MRSGGKESGEEAPLSRLAASLLDFALAAKPRAIVLQCEPAGRLPHTETDDRFMRDRRLYFKAISKFGIEHTSE